MQLETLSNLRIHYPGPVLVLSCPTRTPAASYESVLREFAPAWQLSKPVRRRDLLEWLDTLATRSDAGVTPGLVQPPPDLVGRLEGLSILVADDNRYNRRLLKTLLELEGAEAEAAADGAQALEYFQQTDCNLVLMDAHMPGVDGIEGCRRIVEHAREAGREVVVLGLTADVLEVERQRFLSAGAREVLHKPIDEEDLIRALCRYSGRAYSRESAGIAGPAALSKTALKRELSRQAARLRRALDTGQQADAREIIHQLLGLSGLYGMVDIRQCVVQLGEDLAGQREAVLQAHLEVLGERINGIMGL